MLVIASSIHNQWTLWFSYEHVCTHVCMCTCGWNGVVHIPVSIVYPDSEQEADKLRRKLERAIVTEHISHQQITPVGNSVTTGASSVSPAFFLITTSHGKVVWCRYDYRLVQSRVEQSVEH